MVTLASIATTTAPGSVTIKLTFVYLSDRFVLNRQCTSWYTASAMNIFNEKPFPTLQSLLHFCFSFSLSSTTHIHTPQSSQRSKRQSLVGRLTDCSWKLKTPDSITLSLNLMMTFTDLMNYWMSWTVQPTLMTITQYHSSDQHQWSQPIL